jgi:hypothetical protein
MIAVDVDRAAELFEIAVRDSEILMNFKTDTRMGGIDLVNLIRGRGGKNCRPRSEDQKKSI